MIVLPRLPEPLILIQNREQWLQAYLEQRNQEPRKRPSAKQYGHREIRSTLRAMSFHKCFYWERRLGEHEDEVEHYIEVAERPDLAFAWDNLCLSCATCNSGKSPNVQIPVAECLHPCNDLEDPADPLTFDDEFIRAKASSNKGVKTIQKYRLDRDELNHLRVKHLQKFERLIREIQTHRIQEGNRPLIEREKEIINQFRQPDHPFSLIFSVYLTDVDLS